jgi:hypothetical protein
MEKEYFFLSYSFYTHQKTLVFGCEVVAHQAFTALHLFVAKG